MAAPTLVDSGTGATDAGGAWAYTCQASAAAGRVFIVQILQDGATSNAVTLSSGTNIEDLAGTDNTWTELARLQGTGVNAIEILYIGRALSTSAPTISGGNSTSEDLYIRSYQFQDVNTGSALSDVIENIEAGGTSNSSDTTTPVTDASVETNGPDRLALNFVAINDDTATTSFTGESGGDWTEAATFGSASGTDGQIQLQTAAMASAGTINGGSYTITSNLHWVNIGFALIGTTPDVVVYVPRNPAVNFQDPALV